MSNLNLHIGLFIYYQRRQNLVECVLNHSWAVSKGLLSGIRMQKNYSTQYFNCKYLLWYLSNAKLMSRLFILFLILKQNFINSTFLYCSKIIPYTSFCSFEIYAHTNVCIYRKYTYINIHLSYIYACMHTCTHINHIYIYVHRYMYMYIYTHIYVCMYFEIYVYVCLHTQL